VSKNESFGPVLDGITLPETIILPPEIIPLLPWMSLAELKVVIAAVARLMQVGGAEPITLSEFETLTGLSRPSVLEGIERAMQRGVLTRYEVSGYQGHKSYVYELRVSIGKENLPMALKAKLSQAVVVNTDRLTTSLSLATGDNENGENDAEIQQKKELFERLRKFGVYAKTARMLLQKHDVERIERFLALYPLAQRLGRAEGPGWLVKAIIDPSWDPDIEQADLESRLACQQAQEQAKQQAKQENHLQVLPKRITHQLQEIGWVGDMHEIGDAWETNKRRVTAWLKWAVTQPPEHRVARFLSGLRSGLLPPKSKSNTERRYLEGPYAEFIEH